MDGDRLSFSRNCTGRDELRSSLASTTLKSKDSMPNSYAADIIDKRWGWKKEAETNGFWTVLGEEAKERGLVWGDD